MIAYRADARRDFFAIPVGPGGNRAGESPGYKAERRVCEECCEGISFEGRIVLEGRTLCRACAGDRYYAPL